MNTPICSGSDSGSNSGSVTNASPWWCFTWHSKSLPDPLLKSTAYPAADARSVHTLTLLSMTLNMKGLKTENTENFTFMDYCKWLYQSSSSCTIRKKYLSPFSYFISREIVLNSYREFGKPNTVLLIFHKLKLIESPLFGIYEDQIEPNPRNVSRL